MAKRKTAKKKKPAKKASTTKKKVAKKKASTKARAARATKKPGASSGPARKAATKKITKKAPAKKAPHLHPELDDEGMTSEVKEIFSVYDRDGSGSIDRGELARLLEALGEAPTETELAVALDVIDANHSGRISWSEFKAWWTAR